MEVRLYDAAGAGVILPALLRWEISYGFCDPCDSFEAEFLYAPEMLETLKLGCRFAASEDGKTVFRGVVDEIELNAEASGCTARLNGRGMQALLLDSQAESGDYYGADTEFILNRHVRPLGVTDIRLPANAGNRASLSVSSGESHWSVLNRFAEFCLGLRPRFTPEGTLVLDGAETGKILRVGADTPVTAQRFTRERYGVISSVIVKNRAARSQVRVDNEAFQALGGQSIRVVNVPRYTAFDAMRHTGAYRIEKSQRGMDLCRLCLPVPFAAFPGDRLVLEQTPLGVRGTFLVEESRCFAREDRAGTELTLRPTSE